MNQTALREQVRVGCGERREQAEATAGWAGGGSQGDLRHQARAQHEARYLKIQANPGTWVDARTITSGQAKTSVCLREI